MTKEQQEFNYLKGELIEKINRIDAFITGDPMASPPLKGCQQRITDLEHDLELRLKSRNDLVSMMIGTSAIVIAAALIGIGNLIRLSFLKH